jgi:hypothetical protein
MCDPQDKRGHSYVTDFDFDRTAMFLLIRRPAKEVFLRGERPVRRGFLPDISVFFQSNFIQSVYKYFYFYHLTIV